MFVVFINYKYMKMNKINKIHISQYNDKMTYIYKNDNDKMAVY